MKITSLFFFLLLSFQITAYGIVPQASGKISGKVVDLSTGETLIGVPVLVQGTSFSTVTDLDGKFSIAQLPQGTYSVLFRYVGYSPKIIEGIKITDGKTIILNVNLEINKQQLQEVTVTADLKRENIGSLILMQKKSATMQDGISSEAIRKTPDKNTAELLRRVSGTSIQEGRFVVIRGLNDRYNMAMINGVPLSSTEPDRKAFSFDLFPSSLLDNLIVVKTASPELPGEFAGGVLQLNTRDIPEQRFFSITTGIGMNTRSTFNKYSTSTGGKSDWIGIDDGTRSLPDNFPTADILKRATQAEKIAFSKQLNNDWNIESKEKAPLAQNLQLSFGNSKKIKKREIGWIGALSYTSSLTSPETERSDYDFDGSKNYNFLDQQYRKQIFWGGLLNTTLKWNENNKFSIKSLGSINSEDQTILRTGIDLENQQAIEAMAMKYTSTRFFSGILNGDHYMPSSKINIQWFGSYTHSRQSIPNLRRMYYYRNLDPSSEDTSYFAYVPFGNASPSYAGKFYSELNEHVYNGQVTVSVPLKFLGEHHKLKTGVFEQFKSRNFDARVLGFVVTNPGQFNWNLLQLPIASIFNPQNMGVKGFRIDEITNPSDTYTATSNLHAAFLQFDNLISNKFRFVWGVRVENYIQKLNSFGYSNDTIRVKTNYIDVLPSLNFTYSMNEKTNLRLGVSKTVSRPEFRELAPFGFYDFSTATSVEGNNALLRTEIINSDLRYEYFPDAGQILSFSLFHKYFKNPIEPVVESSGAGSRKISFENAKGAYVMGIELEWRKKLSFLNTIVSSGAWEKISFFGNLALIKSKVDKSNDLRASQDRPLQGQSPYLINSGLNFQDPKSGVGINVVYNRIGKRIYQVGNSGYLSIEESPRNLIDFQISKRVFEKGDIKLTIGDILSENSTFYQDQNQNGRYAADIDSGISTAKTGTNYSLSVSYKF